MNIMGPMQEQSWQTVVLCMQNRSKANLQKRAAMHSLNYRRMGAIVYLWIVLKKETPRKLYHKIWIVTPSSDKSHFSRRIMNYPVTLSQTSSVVLGAPLKGKNWLRELFSQIPIIAAQFCQFKVGFIWLSVMQLTGFRFVPMEEKSMVIFMKIITGMLLGMKCWLWLMELSRKCIRE